MVVEIGKDKIQYPIDIALREAKLEDRLVKQIYYHMLSAYTRNPQNLAINAPSGEGKNFILDKVATLFPKEDVMFLTGMTDKALFHRTGKLVIKNRNTGEYEDLEELIEKLDLRIEDLRIQLAEAKSSDEKQGLKCMIKDVEKEKKELYKDAKKLIDLNHKILIFLDTPRSGLSALMSLLSHDNYEVEYEYADSTASGIKTKTNVLRGWPVIIFAQAKDLSDYARYPEIKRRFPIANPRMDKEKYKAAIELSAQKWGMPDFMYQSFVVSKAEKDKAREIIREIKQSIIDTCESIGPGDSNAVIAFSDAIRNKLSDDKAQDMTVANRLFGYMSLLSIINIEKRDRIVCYIDSIPVTKRLMPIARYDDFKEAVFLMEYTDGLRPHILEWFKKVFLGIFNAKTKPDSKVLRSGEERTEDRKAVTTEELVVATKAKLDRILTTKQILESWIQPLMNEGIIDKSGSEINHRNNIYYPLIFDVEQGPKSNIEQENKTEGLVEFVLNSSTEYIKSKVDQVLSCSIESGIFSELCDNENSRITIDDLIERNFSKVIHGKNLLCNDENDAKNENIEKEAIQIEQEKEHELNPVDQTEANHIRSMAKLGEIEHRTSDPEPNQNNTTFSCRNCNKFETASREEYDHHTVTRHQNKAGYPDKFGRT